MPMRPVRALHVLCALLSALAFGAFAAAAQAQAPNQVIHFTDRNGETIEGGVWLPTGGDRTPRPLVVISHGNGGWYLGHYDTARALTEAGFVVAALSHPGDNVADQSRSLQLTARPPQLSALIDYMTGPWNGPVAVDPKRIGAFGFSAGGFTVTSIVGGVSDAKVISTDCTAHPERFVCQMIAAGGGLDVARWRPEARDARVRAAVIAGPALGASFTTNSLASVRLPVQLWQAGSDLVLPATENAESIRDRLGRKPEYHRVDNAGHYDFLTPCSPQMAVAAPQLCTSAPGFDRAAFKADFNRQVVRFFSQALTGH